MESLWALVSQREKQPAGNRVAIERNLSLRGKGTDEETWRKEKEWSCDQDLDTGVGYAKGRLSHPFTSIVLDGIHACLLCSKGVLISSCFTAACCYLEMKWNEEKWNRGERGNGTKEYSPSIALVPTYLIENENQSFVVRKEMGNWKPMLAEDCGPHAYVIWSHARIRAP